MLVPVPRGGNEGQVRVENEEQELVPAPGEQMHLESQSESSEGEIGGDSERDSDAESLVSQG